MRHASFASACLLFDQCDVLGREHGFEIVKAGKHFEYVGDGFTPHRSRGSLGAPVRGRMRQTGHVVVVALNGGVGSAHCLGGGGVGSEDGGGLEGEEDGSGFFGGELAAEYGVHDLVAGADDIVGGLDVEEVGAAAELGEAVGAAVGEGLALPVVEVAEFVATERERAAAVAVVLDVLAARFVGEVIRHRHRYPPTPYMG